jgi:atypical dual specificity phosphatase
VELLPPGAYTGQWIGEMCVPDDLYWIARAPVALAGMARPGRRGWQQSLHENGVGHIVCLTHDVAPYDAAPCTVSAFRLQDAVAGDPPDDPVSELEVVTRAADDVLSHLERGIGVAVHCMAGRGRTGTVIGVALVRLGHDGNDVAAYLHDIARMRGKRGWPESEWQGEIVRGNGVS